MLILNFNDIMIETKNNPSLPFIYLLKLLNYNNIYPLHISNPLTAIKCFCPLPSLLILKNNANNNINNKIIKNNNEYHLYGSSIISIIYSNIHLPYKNKQMPLPFSFPIYNKTNIEIAISNVYYYEITINDTQDIINNWDEDSIAIGFGTSNIGINTHVGLCYDSFGYHSDTGNIQLKNNKCYTKNISRKWNVGDIIGAGIIFISATKIMPFFTFNGELVYIHDDIFDINKPYFPIISYKYSHSIDVNLSDNKFKFNIKNIISKYSNNIISTNNQFIDGNLIRNNNIELFINHIPTIPTIDIPTIQSIQSIQPIQPIQSIQSIPTLPTLPLIIII
jgi:hypothetical protein